MKKEENEEKRRRGGIWETAVIDEVNPKQGREKREDVMIEEGEKKEKEDD